MAKFYNNSENYLWSKGMAHVFLWFEILIFGYVLFWFLHGPITSINNNFLTISWGIFTLWLMVYWLKTGNKLIESVHSWFYGYISEWVIRRKLLKLSDDFHIIYDYKIQEDKGNIDFVVVCKYGVFTVEVKSYLKVVKSLVYGWPKKAVYQTRNQNERLKKYLKSNGLFVGRIKPILVFACQKEYSPIKNDDVIVLGRTTLNSFFIISLPKNTEVLSATQVTAIVDVLKKK